MISSNQSEKRGGYMSSYATRINNIYNTQLDPRFEKTNVECFKEKELVYKIPLAIILKCKESTSKQEFREHFPLTVGELIEVAKFEEETEQDCLIFIADYELTPRGYALREVL